MARMEPTDRPLVAMVDDDELSDDRSSGTCAQLASESTITLKTGRQIPTPQMFGSAEDLLERGDLGRTGYTMRPLLILVVNATLEGTSSVPCTRYGQGADSTATP